MPWKAVAPSIDKLQMVAMSMADGYARLTGKPQCVIVHVDVGTQGLGAAVHNSSTGRAPVLVFAGLSPFTIEGEMRGSRTEYIHWIQDVPDQKQILAQYCRYSGEIKTGKNVKQMVNRALQFSRSDPQGPVYLCGAREVMEEDIEPYKIPQDEWDPVELGGLPTRAVSKIAAALADAKEPLVITGFGGRDHKLPGALVELANTVKGLRVLDTGGSDMCFPADHPGWLGLRFGSDDAIKTADVIVVLNCDVPWVNTLCHPKKDARIFHVDVDPLKQQMPVFYIKAESRYRGDSLTAVEQITAELKTDSLASKLSTKESDERGQALQQSYEKRLKTIEDKTKPQNGEFGTGYLCRELRRLCPPDTIWAIEAVTKPCSCMITSSRPSQDRGSTVVEAASAGRVAARWASSSQLPLNPRAKASSSCRLWATARSYSRYLEACIGSRSGTTYRC